MVEVSQHPDAPDFEELGQFVLDPVPPAEIERRRERGETLVESNLREHEKLSVTIDLNDNPIDRTSTDNVGTTLYRLVQLFGTPNLEWYPAGSDLSDRTDTTFKYLFRVAQGLDPEDPESVPDREWLLTVHDYHVRLCASVAEWHEDPAADVDVPVEDAIALLVLVKNVCSEPVACEYEGIWY